MRQGNGFSETAWLVWLAGAGCDGCTQALLGAAEPGLEDLILGSIPDVPRLALVHPQFGPHFISQYKNSSRSSASMFAEYDAGWKPGESYEALLRRAAAGELTPFVLALDGALFAEPASGSYAQLGADRAGAPLTVAHWLRLLAPRAEAVLAVGSCASFGGLPGAAGAWGEVEGVEEILGAGFKSRGGLPVIQVPGCAPAGEGVIETLSYIFLHLARLVPLDLDEARRPRWLYNKETYPLPPRADYPPAVEFEAARQLKVFCPTPAQGWTRGLGGCTRVGGGCIACTEPGFADRHLPLARPDAAL